MIKLSAEEILRISEVNDYSAKQLREAFDSLAEKKAKIENGEKIYASGIGYVMNIISSVHELLTRPLENSEATGTATGKKLSE